MVPAGGIDQSDQQVFVVNPLKETAVYVARMPGGVRGGGREAPLYSIVSPAGLGRASYRGASPLSAFLHHQTGPHFLNRYI